MADGVWRDGDLLVLDHKSRLPERCIKCNGPADGKRHRVNLVWSAHGNPMKPDLIGSTLFLFTKQRAAVEIALCARHQRNRRRLVRVLVALTILGITIAGVAIYIGTNKLLPRDSALGPGLALTGFGLTIMPVMSYAFWFALLTPVGMDERFIRLEGAGRPFLDSLDPLTAAAAQTAVRRR